MASIECPSCAERFSTEGAARDHAWEAHSACHHCGDQFEAEDDLYVHWLVVHEDDLSQTDRKRAETETGGVGFGNRVAEQGAVETVKETAFSRRGVVALSGGGLVAVVGGAFAGGLVMNDRGDDQTLEGHPATLAFRNQPTYGPTPTNAEGTIVAFEDPSCPSCGRFEREVFPKLKERLIDPGKVSLVFRGVPIVRPWGETGVPALEAAYARSPDAFRALKDYYFRTQSEFDAENVLDRTRQFLADETEVDAEAVVTAVENGDVSTAVDVDQRAAQDAGVRGTPTFFLFDGESFVTEVNGPQSYDVFANSLGVSEE